MVHTGRCRPLFKQILLENLCIDESLAESENLCKDELFVESKTKFPKFAVFPLKRVLNLLADEILVGIRLQV